MLLIASLIGSWEKLSSSSHTNFAIFTFLFMICAIEVVLLKITHSSPPFLPRRDSNEFDELSDSSDEDIYYEDVPNNYEQWARRRMRYRQRQQRREQELLRQFQRQQAANPLSRHFFHESATMV